MPARLFHIATISNDLVAYHEMRTSMAAAGFTEQTCRFSVLDNSTANRHDPYQVLRDLPRDGEEPYYVLCHHDLRFGIHTRFDRLSTLLAELDRVAPRWAVAGDAGITDRGERVLHIDDPSGSYRSAGLPRQVVTLDENWLLVRRATTVWPSPGLSGFHFYGADLCLNAAVERRTCHVIDFPVTHLSGGTASPAFYAALDALTTAWRPRLLVGVVGTTCADFQVSAWRPLERLLHRPWGRRWARRLGVAVLPRRHAGPRRREPPAL